MLADESKMDNGSRFFHPFLSDIMHLKDERVSPSEYPKKWKISPGEAKPMRLAIKRDRQHYLKVNT